MPNHFHGIIGIGENPYNSDKDFPNGGLFEGRDAMHRVSTGPKNSFGPQSENLGSIICGSKSAVATPARKIGLDFAWQARYHDHIIRDKAQHHRIKTYFRDDPENWRQTGNIRIQPVWKHELMEQRMMDRCIHAVFGSYGMSGRRHTGSGEECVAIHSFGIFSRR